MALFGLSDDQQLVLFLHSYFGKPQKEVFAGFCREFAFTESSLSEIQAGLQEKGYLEYTSSYWYKGYDIRARWFLDAALCLLHEHAPIVRIFQKFKTPRNAETQIRWEIALAWDSGRYADIQHLISRSYLFGPHHLIEMLLGRSDDDGPVEEAFHAIAPDLIYQGFSVTLSGSLLGEYGDAQFYRSITNLRNRFDAVRSKVPDYSSFFLDENLETCRWLSLGGPLNTDMMTSSGRAAHAISALYGGDTGKALEHFATALKFNNRALDAIKNIFINPLLCLFLILAYKKSDTQESRKKVDQFLKKEASRRYPSLMAAEFAGEFISTGMDEQVSLGSYLTAVAKSCGGRLGTSFASLFAEYFKFPVSKIKADRLLLDSLPRTAVLRHEISAYRDVEDEPFLLESFGGPPVLSSIRSRSAWELALENVMAGIDKDAVVGSVSAEKKTSRVAYVLSTGRHMEIREQNLLKNGKWGKGKLMTVTRLKSGEPFMDDTDRNVAAAIRDYYGSSCYFEDVALALAGCDRVFLEPRYGAALRPVTILEERPWISVMKDGTGIKIRSCASSQTRYDWDKLNFIVTKKDDCNYTVTRLSGGQKRLISGLTAINHYPMAALPIIKTIVSRINGGLEVRSDLFETKIEKIAGDHRTTLRISPGQENCQVETVVVPLEGGRLAFVPSEGDQLIYDERDSVRYAVSRDLAKEGSAFSALSDFLEEISGKVLNPARPVQLPHDEVLSLMDFAASREEDYILQWPSGNALLIKGSLSSSSISGRLSSGMDWFEMEGEVEIGDERIALESLLSSIEESNLTGFVRIGDNQYVRISEALRKQLQSLASLRAGGKNKGRISKFRVGQLAEVVRSSGLRLEADSGFDDLCRKIQEAANYEAPLSKALNATLRDYQKEGFRHLARLDSWGAGGCLADDMGLGKTVQAITFLLHKADSGPSLVVAPASVVLNWERELSRFAPSLKVHVLNGNVDRTAILGALGPWDVVLSSYGVLVSSEKEVTATDWNVVCLDEAHTIRNRGTKMSAAAMNLKASSRVILTGTPVQNWLGELWNLFQFLNPGLFGTFEDFSRKFIVPIEQRHDKKASALLKRLIQPFMLRRTKAEVMDDLPEKNEITMPVSLSEDEMAAYEVLRRKASGLIDDSSTVDVNVLAEITKLRMAACDLSLVRKGRTKAGSKVGVMMDMVSEIVGGGNRALIFSQFTSFLAIIREALDKEGIPYFYLDGSTPIRQRDAMVTDFQKGEKPLFVISLKAGGLGLNLTGANYVIHLDPWWNPAVEQQATDRAYRIGQTQDVTVYHLISQHTIEEKILRLHKTKRDLADLVLAGEAASRALTLEDLRELTSI